jgi:hypothetical protein
MSINLDSLSVADDLNNVSFISDDTTENAAGFEELHSSRLNASRDKEDHNRSLSSIDLPVLPTPRSRSNSLNIAPIEIDHRTARAVSNTSFAPPLLDVKEFPLSPSKGILADEVDLLDGFVSMPPPEEEEMYYPGSGKKSGYDDDEDDAAGKVEEALLNAAKEAQGLSGNCTGLLDAEVDANLAASELRGASSVHDS